MTTLTKHPQTLAQKTLVAAGRASMIVAAAAFVITGSAIIAPTPSHAEWTGPCSGTTPSPKPQNQVKHCGVALYVYTYIKSRYVSGGRVCYDFKAKAQACSYKDWYDRGIMTACKQYG